MSVHNAIKSGELKPGIDGWCMQISLAPSVLPWRFQEFEKRPKLTPSPPNAR